MRLSRLLVLVALLLAGGAHAQGFPARPIRFIVPYVPGGGTDIMFRNIEKILSQNKLVPQPVNIVNKPGGGGAIGKAYCLSRPADGYTFTCFDLGTVSQQIEGKAKWDFRKDFAYIARLVSDINLLIARTDAPYNSAKDIVEAIKQKGPKSISVAGTGTYAADHLGNIKFKNPLHLLKKFVVRITLDFFEWLCSMGPGKAFH